METKHRKGDFFIPKETLQLVLASGAPNKESRLRSAVSSLFASSELLESKFPNVIISRQTPSQEVVELNGIKSAPEIYIHKAVDTQRVMKGELDKDAIALTADAHSKGGREGEKLDMVLVKYDHPEQLLTYADRLEGLSKFISGNFSQFSAGEPLLLRAGIGVIPWSGWIWGLIDMKFYTYYEKNPLPDQVAARDFLQMSAETHVAQDGTFNNRDLSRSIKIAGGGIAQEDLMKFAAMNGIGIETRGRTPDPIAELDQIGDNFPSSVVLTVLEMIAGLPYTIANERSTRISPGRVHMLPQRRDKIVWSSGENRLRSEYVGQYNV